MIHTKRYEYSPDLFPVNEREVWRYAGYAGLPPESEGELNRMFREAEKEINSSCSFSVCYETFKLEWKDGKPELPFETESLNLAKCLTGSTEVVMFAATIGIEADRKTARAKMLSPAKALIMQAFGAERVECLCEVFCREMKEKYAGEGRSVTPRFSPGYGDLKLSVQKDFFRILEINKNLAVSLGDNLLMTPTKSVTAVFGIKPGH